MATADFSPQGLFESGVRKVSGTVLHSNAALTGAAANINFGKAVIPDGATILGVYGKIVTAFTIGGGATTCSAEIQVGGVNVSPADLDQAELKVGAAGAVTNGTVFGEAMFNLLDGQARVVMTTDGDFDNCTAGQLDVVVYFSMPQELV